MLDPLDPFELHPNDKKKIEKIKKDECINVKEVKKIINKKIKWIKRKRAPTWGYKVDHVNAFFVDVIKEIEKSTGDKK
jgi:hypothetical protein